MKQARIEDRHWRLEVQVERAIEKRTERGELLQVNADCANGRFIPQTAKGYTTTAAKRPANTDLDQVPQKATRLHGLKEVPRTM